MTSALSWRIHRWTVDRFRRLGTFPADARKRVLFLSLANLNTSRISLAQLFPFFYYANEIGRRWGIAFREVPSVVFEANPGAVAGPVDVVFFQTNHTLTREGLLERVGRIRKAYPGAKLVYLDWFAPTDLRYAAVLNDHVDAYVKKHLVRDRDQYGKPTWGDTNLTDFYVRRHGLEAESQCYPVPESFFEKLFVGSSFAIEPRTIGRFLGTFPASGERPIDLHMRITVEGEPWYAAMRREAMQKASELKNMRVVKEGFVRRRKYERELRQSKMCFSPFGYGEVCWRDYEAVVAGSLLIKPDMSHIETWPDIFVAGKTYVPIAWDLSDLEEKCRYYLEHPGERLDITRAAFKVVQDYLRNGGFLEQIRPLFEKVGLIEEGE